MWKRPISFVNARIVAAGGVAQSIRFSARVLDIDGPPHPGDSVVDLEGAFVLPGLINAHDHLELNHYGPLKRRDRYVNASAWIDDLRPALRADPAIRANSGHPLAARLFIGGLKNLLAGATTIAHHNPYYREIDSASVVRVVRRYGWAHSFSLERDPVGAHGEPGGTVLERCEQTPVEAPFIVHVAEGVDDAAAAELPRLTELGCLRPNTVLVHGLALSTRDWSQVMAAGAALVWCPASNAFLFGRTVAVREFLDTAADAWRHICLGSDSRITGARDLLDELRAGAAAGTVTPAELLRMVTTAPAQVLRLPDAGRLAVGGAADLVVVPSRGDDAGASLLASSRRDLSLVVIDGRPLVGDPDLGAVFRARRTTTRRIAVDGVERLAAAHVAASIARCPIREPGVAALQ